SAVLVERSVTGTDWRLLVVGERVVAVRRLSEPGSSRGESGEAGGKSQKRLALDSPLSTLDSRGATAGVPPEVGERAVDAARAVGLEIAGVDVVAEDIGRPLEAQGGAVVRVHARPGLVDGGWRPVGGEVSRESRAKSQEPEGSGSRLS